MDLSQAPHGRPTDFDFLVGTWSVANRRLKHRWTDNPEWIEFPGREVCSAYLEGAVNIDEIDCSSMGFKGFTLRTFERASQRWSIYWINSNQGVLTPPVHGGFDGAHGEFWGEDEDDGIPVQVKFFWHNQGGGKARWSQAFSRDGAYWEVNWISDFTRL